MNNKKTFIQIQKHIRLQNVLSIKTAPGWHNFAVVAPVVLRPFISEGLPWSFSYKVNLQSVGVLFFHTD
jgi:hypothetical protein